MTSLPDIDDFGDSLKNLPNELHRHFTLMQDLDSRSQNLMTDIDKISKNYLSNVNKYSAEKKKETMSILQHKFDAAKQFSDDKVELSNQTYALVDKRIMKLDNVIANFESKLKMKIRNAAINSSRNLQPKEEGSKISFAASLVTESSNANNIIDNVAEDTGAMVDSGVVHSDYVDMPIDPNEPTFCLCKQVSFGEMIACDNTNCAIEWFHFACVGLVSKPKGKWFCPKCNKDKKKK